MTEAGPAALALQSSGPELGLAVRIDDRYHELRIRSGLRHGSEALPALDALLRLASVEPASLELVVVDRGPGSFTGLRIALSVARGLQAANPGLAVCGVSGLEVCVRGLPVGGQALAVIDGKKRRYYCLRAPAGARFSAIPEQEIQDLPPQVIREHWADQPLLITGTGAVALASDLSAPGGPGVPSGWHLDPRAGEPSLRLLLELGRDRAARGLLMDDAEGPLYARASQAEESDPV